MKLYLVRHAQSKRNAKVISTVDAELTDIGEEQARRLGAHFHNIKLDKIYCSPRLRAKATFERIKPFVKKVPVVYTEKIAEINMGEFGNNGMDDWEGYFKTAWNSGKPYHQWRPKNGESLQDVYERAGKFYRELLKKHSDEAILIVGHGFHLMYVILNALGLDLFESRYYQLNNATVSTLEINKGKVNKFHINDYHQLIKEGLKSK